MNEEILKLVLQKAASLEDAKAFLEAVERVSMPATAQVMLTGMPDPASERTAVSTAAQPRTTPLLDKALPRRRRNYTAEEEALIREEWDKDTTVEEIAHALERTPRGIYLKAVQVLGLSPRSFDRTFSASTVASKAPPSDRSDPRHRRRWSAEEIVKLRELINHNISTREMARCLRRTQRSIEAKMDELKTGSGA